MISKTNYSTNTRNSYYRGHELFIAKMQDHIDFVKKTHRYVQTSFLSPVEQTILKQILPRDLYLSFYGGFDQAQRKIAFISEMEVEPDYDYVLLSSVYSKEKRELSHKDVLGALMHLGIKREQLGDLIVQEEKIFVLCKEIMASFIKNECRRIGNVSVHFKEDYTADIQIVQTQPVIVVCSSLRMDAIVACLGKCSRARAAEMIKKGYVKLNDVVLEENCRLCNNDYVSIRKTGRFRFLEVENRTRKDRLVLRFEKFI